MNIISQNDNSPPARRRRRPRQSTPVFVLEMISAVAGAGAVIAGLVYIGGRFCWWAVPGSTGGGRRDCGNMAKYLKSERLADPGFIPSDMVSLGHWGLADPDSRYLRDH
ncbi:hypothetical protein [Leptolyngbya sp. 7M]|uniref:hypothetical protein n=1 Tax=Leptolyngbya sp. 7M TaxID=2812896 RepID=UPI001B8C6E53|nr:hypothetical protein [Leptolyngbya sp. 7M]QYO65676.1 hypothetical protein JVX88_02485 [Leptolyngbya sp. 7M]